ncbi:DUF4405 domain-containing protein [Gemmobacter lutimaris]|uniref:DUF4405 domain-containing protein n=1 Tax=Gemmobacter lutimaris TaxID=2306023 RepID=A0A398BUV9_9RHOB|nr:DUF4405 domain-containing protein [Gemmobacter lutimaris]RID93504.1 DUF4405 domain-containing protein [Gemmobacter lutimaris]
MKSMFLRYATPFTTGLFLVSLVSGVALFFHIGPMAFHGMHEWLSMVLILPFVLHVWRNWRPMTAYFRHVPMMVALAASVLAGAVFFLPSGGTGQGGRPPQFAVANRLLAATPAQVAPALGLSETALRESLTSAGFAVPTGAESLHDLATAAGQQDSAILAVLASTAN